MVYYPCMISREDIEGLAALSRLKLTDAEIANLQKDISDIVGYVEAVSQVEIPSAVGADGPAHAAASIAPQHRNIMREDVLRTGESAARLAGKEEQVRAAFPTRQGDFNVVRKIIQKDE